MSSPITKALSIRQPWAWLILNAGKDIENRSWSTRFRGSFAIHASKGCAKVEYEDAVSYAQMIDSSIVVPALADLPRGGLVGVVELTDVIDTPVSPWHMHGQIGFILSDPQSHELIPLKGKLGFFNIGETGPRQPNLIEPL